MRVSHDPGVVAASFAIALFASYVTLDLARQLRHSTRQVALAWWAAGSLVMGTGVWSMHFLGMQAFALPIPVGFDSRLTLLSWLVAVSASGMALRLASRQRVGRRHLAFGAGVMGLGISAMHYIGMGAMRMAPGIVWNQALVALSVLISLLASATALCLFNAFREAGRAHRHLLQGAAALVMAVAIFGMHYTGMAAAHFATGSVSLSAGELSGPGMTALVLMATLLLLVSTLFTSVLDARLQSTARRLAQSLQESNARLQAANDELQKRALSDALTGLPNRLHFEDRLREALQRHHGAGPQTQLAVLFVDLDGFKPINDSFGHAAGDLILCRAAERLLHEVPSPATVARVGGDEFLVLLEGAGQAEAMGVAQRLLATLAQPFGVSGKPVQIAGSIGIAAYPGHSEGSKLVASADAAMYAAKRAGGGRYKLFEPHMESDAAWQLELQNALRGAIERNELALHYQPKIDVRQSRSSGVEALLRWNHPVHGAIAPAVFIALAERFGLIGKIGNWVIEEACRQMAEWAAQGLRMRVAINLSVHQLREDDLAGRIENALRAHGIDAGQLLCEITETVAMEDTRATQHTFDGLARIGVYLSIDDFGTGYSSLNYLRHLPARQLKIDSSFVSDLEHSQQARSMVGAVVGLAHALGLSVVAEGVETQGQRDILLAAGCDEFQGFFFARPMPASVLMAWLQARHPHDAGNGLAPTGAA
nr:bifunctional diguanylate cyclase/phosphodiesterase [Acidovorax sp. D4N7]